MLWSPTQQEQEKTTLYRFWRGLKKHPELHAPSIEQGYEALHRWSIDHYPLFWKHLLTSANILYTGNPQAICPASSQTTQTSDTPQQAFLPNAPFFPEITLNFSENMLRYASGNQQCQPALVAIKESGERQTFSYQSLYQNVSRVAHALTAEGVIAGDRVVGILPNGAEAVIAMLAATSIGAIWSSCSPDFGPQGVIDRFGQIKPRVLFGTNGYRYGGKIFDCRNKLENICKALPSLTRIVLCPFEESLPATLNNEPRSTSWQHYTSPSNRADKEPIPFAQLPFNHPLYIVYSSGTTGLPKCIVHGAGGTLVQHIKEHQLHCDLQRGDRILYFTTCGWMMWNWLVSSLFTGATVVLYDGSPAFPNTDRLWELVSQENITHFGTSPKYIGSCRNNLSQEWPSNQTDNTKNTRNFESLRVILSTGAPLLPEDFDWIYTHIKPRLQLSSISGGTDILSCFMLGNPMLPVIRGEIQCIGLGMDVIAADENHLPTLKQKGELICRSPFPSAPIYFWDDDNKTQYNAAYFHSNAGLWHHRDYIEITGSNGYAGGVVVYGRSDTTLNPGGVRIGTAEIYRLVETMPQVSDSIVVGVPHNNDIAVILFIQLKPEFRPLHESLIKHIKDHIKQGATPRHVPHAVISINAIPYTLSGKKVELAVQQILTGKTPANRAVLANPDSLNLFENIDLTPYLSP